MQRFIFVVAIMFAFIFGRWSVALAQPELKVGHEVRLFFGDYKEAPRPEFNLPCFKKYDERVALGLRSLEGRELLRRLGCQENSQLQDSVEAIADELRYLRREIEKLKNE